MIFVSGRKATTDKEKDFYKIKKVILIIYIYLAYS
jgi:hypothetical protein